MNAHTCTALLLIQQVTISPSMDICVSSNFERYLFHLCGDDAVSEVICQGSRWHGTCVVMRLLSLER
jgi:threonine synthase